MMFRVLVTMPIYRRNPGEIKKPRKSAESKKTVEMIALGTNGAGKSASGNKNAYGLWLVCILNWTHTHIYT